MTAVTATHLMRLELALLIAIAVLFLFAPMVTARVLGLPPAGSSFWPRLVGGLHLAIATAVAATDLGWLTVTTANGPLATGIGLGAFVAINLTLAFVLASMLMFGTLVPTRRGRLFLWAVTIVSAALGLVEIAYVR